jgi:hypothetical protein
VFDTAVHDRAVYLPTVDAVVVADLHVGRADASDVAAPLGEGADLAARLASVVERFAPGTVVFAGDVLHEFGRVGDVARETIGDLSEVCLDAGARPVMVAGNHDGLLSTVWDGDVHEAYRLDEAGDGDRRADDGGTGGDRDGGAGGVVVCHGHEEPPTGSDGRADTALYVVGHDHPAITIEGQKRPCFLYGEGQYRGGDLLMLPAFTRVAAGVVVNGMRTRDFRSPLVRDADALRPIVWDQSRDEALTFPPLGRFRRLL